MTLTLQKLLIFFPYSNIWNRRIWCFYFFLATKKKRTNKLQTKSNKRNPKRNKKETYTVKWKMKGYKKVIFIFVIAKEKKYFLFSVTHEWIFGNFWCFQIFLHSFSNVTLPGTWENLETTSYVKNIGWFWGVGHYATEIYGFSQNCWIFFF